MAKRTINLPRRTATVSNMNFKPEQHGDELVERVDLSLELLLEGDDIDAIIDTGSNPLKVLWDRNQEPMLRELSKLELDFKAEGKAELGYPADEPLAFDPAVLKKVTIEPMIGLKATMRCQVRVDPTDHLEALADMVIKRTCSFSFVGRGAPEKDEKQNNLNV